MGVFSKSSSELVAIMADQTENTATPALMLLRQSLLLERAMGDASGWARHAIG